MRIFGRGVQVLFIQEYMSEEYANGVRLSAISHWYGEIRHAMVDTKNSWLPNDAYYSSDMSAESRLSSFQHDPEEDLVTDEPSEIKG